MPLYPDGNFCIAEYMIGAADNNPVRYKTIRADPYRAAGSVYYGAVDGCAYAY
jgi:hypothetical protein